MIKDKPTRGCGHAVSHHHYAEVKNFLLGAHLQETFEARNNVYEAIEIMMNNHHKVSKGLEIEYTTDDFEAWYLYYVSQQYKHRRNLHRFRPGEEFIKAVLYWNEEKQIVSLDIYMKPDLRFSAEPEVFKDVIFSNDLTPELACHRDVFGFQ